MIALFRQPKQQQQSQTNFRSILSLASCLLACLFVSLQITAVSAQDDRGTSLDIVPQTAAFYYASMNHEAQMNAILESNAWERMMDSPVGKNMRSAYRKGKRRGFEQFGFGNPFAEYLEAYRESMGNEMAPLIMSPIKQILGQEIFIYAEEDWLELSRATTDFYTKAAQHMEGVDNVENMSEEDIKAMLAIAREHLTDARTPTLVFGTVLDEPSGVKSLLQIAESGIDGMIGDMPESMNPLVDGYDVIDEKNLYLLTLQLDAESLPWDELENDADMAPYLDDMKAIAKGKTFNLSVGIKNDFLIMAISDSNQHILDMGKGELLRDHPKFAPLRKAAAGKALTSVAYYSEASAVNSAEQSAGIFDSLVQGAIMGIELADEREAMRGLTEELQKDAAELKEDLMPMFGNPGARLGFSYMDEEGIEGFIYNWAENKNFDASKPLSILKNVGSAPVIVSAGRDVGGAENFKLMRKWGGKLYGYVTKYAPREMNNTKDAVTFVQIAGEVRSILADVADATENDMMPAISGQETAFVMDWSNEKKSWHVEMPRSSKPLPGPAMGVIAQHTDRDKIMSAGNAYYDAAIDMLEVIRAIPDSQVPDEIDIFPPQHEAADNGDFYMYRLPAEAGLDDDFALHAFVTDSHLVLGHSIEQTNRLMAGNSADLDEIVNSSNLAMSAFYYNNERMIEVIDAWAGYAIDQVKENGGKLDMDFDADNDLLEFTEEQLLETWERVMDVGKCFKGISSRTYSDDGAQVTHYRMRFQDVDDE